MRIPIVTLGLAVAQAVQLEYVKLPTLAWNASNNDEDKMAQAFANAVFGELDLDGDEIVSLKDAHSDIKNHLAGPDPLDKNDAEELMDIMVRAAKGDPTFTKENFSNST